MMDGGGLTAALAHGCWRFEAAEPQTLTRRQSKGGERRSATYSSLLSLPQRPQKLSEKEERAGRRARQKSTTRGEPKNGASDGWLDFSIRQVPCCYSPT
eukprot:scaffold162857_cov33-Tisochrysis_lutea.AAC.1